MTGAPLRCQTGHATVRAWNIGFDQGVVTIQPSPTIGEAINGGYPWLRVLCSGCGTYALLDLRDIRRPAWTPVWRLEGALACAHRRMNGVRAPRAVIDRLSASMASEDFAARRASWQDSSYAVDTAL